jgi:hypothetical protein
MRTRFRIWAIAFLALATTHAREAAEGEKLVLVCEGTRTESERKVAEPVSMGIVISFMSVDNTELGIEGSGTVEGFSRQFCVTIGIYGEEWAFTSSVEGKEARGYLSSSVNRTTGHMLAITMIAEKFTSFDLQCKPP